MKKIFLTVLLYIQTAMGAEYFVATDGNDEGNGSINQPWHSLSHAFEQLQDGDTLTLRAGVYRLIEEVDLNTINTPNLTFQGHEGEQVDILGSYSTQGLIWEAYDNNIWRIPADDMTRDPTGMFNGGSRISHQSDLDGGRDHDHVSNLITPNHWTKADINGIQCFQDNAECYIYLYPQVGEDPNSETYELAQRSLARVAGNGHHMVVRNLNFYYTQSAPIFFESADYITLENNTFAHTSNGNDNAYAVRIWDSQGSVVRNNKIYDSVYWGGTSNSKGVSFMVTKTGDPNIVEYNEIYDIPGRSAVGTKGGTSNLIVRYNYIHDVFNAFEPGSFRCVWSSTNTDGCQESDEEYRPAGNWQIYGNIIANSTIGLILTAYDNDNNNNQLYNNVFYNVRSGVELGWDGTWGTLISNNIFANSEVGIYLHSGGTTTSISDYLDQYSSHHNLFFNNSHADIHLRPNWGGNFYSGTPYELNTFQNQYSSHELSSLATDPIFANTLNFQLLETSPAVNAGDGSLWSVPQVNIGAHPFDSLTDLIFASDFETDL